MLNARAGQHRWWEAKQAALTPTYAPQPVRSVKSMKFKNSDPMERFRSVRYAVAVVSVIAPILVLWHTGLLRLRHQGSAPASATVTVAGIAYPDPTPIRAALEREPDRPDLLRSLANASLEISPAEARRCFNRLDQLKLSTDEDRASHARLLASLHDFTGAKAVLTRVSVEARNAPATHRAWLAVWREAADFTKAAEALDHLAATNTDITMPALELAETMASSSQPAGQAINAAMLTRIESHLAKALSAKMSNGRSSEVLALAPRLTALRWAGAAVRAQAGQILRNLPGAPAEYRMAAVRLGYPETLSQADRPALQQSWLDEVTWSGGLSAREKDRVAAYLQVQREHDLVAQLIPFPEAMTEPALFTRRFASLLETGRWREAGTMSAGIHAPLLPDSRNLASALATLHKPSPQSRLAERLLTDALAEGRSVKYAAACYAIGCAALDHSLPKLASNAFAAALDFSTDRQHLMEDVTNTAQKIALPIATLLRALEGTESIGDDHVQNQLLYLNLLAGNDVETMSQVIHNRRAQAPDDVYLQFLEAFALHQRGLFSQAAKLLVPLPRYRWHQGEAAVIACIISVAGGMERSAALLSQVQAEALFPEERTLAEPWLNRLTSQGPVVTSTNGAGGQ